jgi:hypothetical protein
MPNAITDLKKQDDDALRELATLEIDACLARLRFFARTTSVSVQDRDEALVDTLVMKLAETAGEIGIDLEGLIDALRAEYAELGPEESEPEAAPAPQPVPIALRPVP